MPNVLHQHFCHAPGDGLSRRCSNEVGALRRDFFDWGQLGGFSEEGDFADIVALTDDSRDIPLGIDGDETPDVISGELLDGIVNREVLVDGVIDAGVATLVPGISGGEALLDRREAGAELGLLTTCHLRGEGTGDSGGDGEHDVSIWYFV